MGTVATYQPPQTPTEDDSRLPRVTLLTSSSCHLCEDAHSELLDRVATGQLGLEVVAVASPRGRALMAHHRPSLFPLVLVDGEYLSAGRLPRRKLDHILAKRADH